MPSSRSLRSFRNFAAPIPVTSLPFGRTSFWSQRAYAATDCFVRAEASWRRGEAAGGGGPPAGPPAAPPDNAGGGVEGPGDREALRGDRVRPILEGLPRLDLVELRLEPAVRHQVVVLVDPHVGRENGLVLEVRSEERRGGKEGRCR